MFRSEDYKDDKGVQAKLKELIMEINLRNQAKIRELITETRHKPSGGGAGQGRGRCSSRLPPWRRTRWSHPPWRRTRWSHGCGNARRWRRTARRGGPGASRRRSGKRSGAALLPRTGTGPPSVRLGSIPWSSGGAAVVGASWATSRESSDSEQGQVGSPPREALDGERSSGGLPTNGRRGEDGDGGDEVANLKFRIAGQICKILNVYRTSLQNVFCSTRETSISGQRE